MDYHGGLETSLGVESTQEFSSDRSLILGTTSVTNIRKQISETTLTNTSFNTPVQNNHRFRKPLYMFKDFTSHVGPVESHFFMASDTTFYFDKRAIFVAAVILSFVLGFTFGAVFPIYPAQKRTSFMADLLTRNKTSSQLSDSLNVSSVRSVLPPILVDGIYWSDNVERSVPLGFGDDKDRRWKDLVSKAAIVRIEEGCGRMQNRLVTFRDGKKACCRYRQNTDQIQGEIFSYYLGRLMNLKNLVPSTLVMINSSDPQWLSVKVHLESSQWAEGHSVVFTEFLEDLVPAQIPLILRHHARNIFDIDNQASSKKSSPQESLFKAPGTGRVMNIEAEMKSEKDTVEMAQWSDLIVFDYLTANLDRIVNNLYNLQWNPSMLSSPAHNLVRVAGSELLVFLDNESGLLHGYRLLDKYEPYHSLLIDSLCVFRKATVDALRALRLHSELGELLARGLPSPELLPPLPEKNINILSQRIKRVLLQVESCAKSRPVYI